MTCEFHLTEHSLTYGFYNLIVPNNFLFRHNKINKVILIFIIARLNVIRICIKFREFVNKKKIRVEIFKYRLSKFRSIFRRRN